MLLNPLPLVFSAADLCDIMLWILKLCPTKYEYMKILPARAEPTQILIFQRIRSKLFHRGLNIDVKKTKNGDSEAERKGLCCAMQ